MPSSFQSPYGGRGFINIRYTREQQQQSNQRQPYQREMQYSKQHHHHQQQKLERYASAHEYVQKLNNVSAVWIEFGNYDKAIKSLGKALKLFDNDICMTDQLLDPFTSQDCSIDSCIHHTENDSNLVEVLDKNSRRTMDANNDDGDNSNTLYRRPIRIPKRIIREGPNMGSTLFIIVTFNLALAHHLKAIKNDSSSSSSSLLLLNGTVELYNLANNWQQQ